MVVAGQAMDYEDEDNALLREIALDFVARHGEHSLARVDEITRGLLESGATRTACEWMRIRSVVLGIMLSSGSSH